MGEVGSPSFSSSFSGREKMLDQAKKMYSTVFEKNKKRVGWLVGWLAHWLVGWLDGWLVGWLVG